MGASVMGGSPPGWFTEPGCSVIGGSAPCPCCAPCCGERVIGGRGVLTGCADEGSCGKAGCPKLVCPKPGGVTGRSLGRCSTAAFTCCGSFVAVVLFVLFVLPVVFVLFALVVLPLGELPANWPLLSVGGFCTR